MEQAPEKIGVAETGPALSFDEGAMTLLLDVHLDGGAPLWLKHRAQQEGLREKSEFHITLIGSKTGKKLLAMLDGVAPKERARVVQEMRALFHRFAWASSPREEYYVISKEYPIKQSPGETETRRSLVQIVELPDLVEFYQGLRQLTGLDETLPLAHITLFAGSTLKDNELRGIGIYSKDQFEELNPQRVVLDEVES